jgi:hypothetical protein
MPLITVSIPQSSIPTIISTIMADPRTFKVRSDATSYMRANLTRKGNLKSNPLREHGTYSLKKEIPLRLTVCHLI